MQRFPLRSDVVGCYLPCRRLLAVAFLLLMGAARLPAAEDDLPASPKPTTAAAALDAASAIDLRFAAKSPDTPDFRRHIVPLLGRLGCNGRACHGSFQGRGGFQLSLFGYDFKADHANLLGGDEPRTNVADPETSLILEKPLEETPHEGGRRLERGSWQHRVLVAWITGGALPAATDGATLRRLEVEPRQLLFSEPGQQRSLRAVAVWSDGSREDVTPLCRFQSNDDQVATIDEAGLVTASGPGDTHVVAFYDDGVVPVPVLMPVSQLAGDRFPTVPTANRIDELVFAKLGLLGVVPSDLCDDAGFLRRVSLDIAGTLPSPPEIEAFLADARPDKRTRKVDELLASPAHAAWWATRFCDWTGNNDRQNQNNGPDGRNVATAAWYEWLRVRLAGNMPYDEIVEGIVLAKSRLDDESYADYCDRMSGYQHRDAEGSFADQPYLPYFWSRNGFQTPEQRALGFAYTFLGVRIQCAQCHKHPFDEWTKDDFARFQNFFVRVRYGEAPGTKDEVNEMLDGLGIDPKARRNNLNQDLAKLVRTGSTVPYRETYVVEPVRPKGKKSGSDKSGKERDRKDRDRKVVGRTATVLGGEESLIDAIDDPRQVLMDWMRDAENPYFARAIVNRIWSAYFNVGIVEPPDDLSLANPPSNGPLLEYLAGEFRRRGYDLRWLHREIATSRTYQTGWRPNDTNRLDERNFSHAVPRRIPAEVLLDAIRMATAGDKEAAAMAASCPRDTTGEPTAAGWGKAGQYALTVFGRSVRASNCDCDRSMEPSLLQTVFLRNDRDMLGQIERKNGWVDQLVRDHGGGGKKEPVTADLEPDAVTGIVRQAYLRTLSRPPLESEVTRAAAHFSASTTVREAATDLLWALLNTKEFVVNH